MSVLGLLHILHRCAVVPGVRVERLLNNDLWQPVQAGSIVRDHFHPSRAVQMRNVSMIAGSRFNLMSETTRTRGVQCEAD